MKQKGFASLMLIVIVLVILGIASFILFTKKSEPLPNYSTNTPTSSPIESEMSKNQVIKKYTSTKLGVSFEYPDEAGVKEIGNKIYVYYKETKPEDGQYVEVFSKDGNKDLKVTLEDKFLAGKPDFCEVEIFEKTPQHPTYVSATITFPIDPDNYESLFTKTKECGENYSMTNGRRYFIYDPQHTSQYAFISIGQYSIDLKNHPSAATWEQTIKFLK